MTSLPLHFTVLGDDFTCAGEASSKVIAVQETGGHDFGDVKCYAVLDKTGKSF